MIFRSVFFVLAFGAWSHAQLPQWFEVQSDFILQSGTRLTEPTTFRTYHFDYDEMMSYLALAPMEGQSPIGLNLELPTSDGSLVLFDVVESPVMAPELSDRHPEIRSYRGQGIDDRSAVLRMDISPIGVHAMWRSAAGTMVIDPYQSNDSSHVIAYHRNALQSANNFECLTQGEFERVLGAGPVGHELLTFRVAIAATGEYTQYHGNLGPGDPEDDALAAINTALNRVNMIYETDLAIRMVLIPNNDLIIYTNGATDPYTNNSGGAMLGQNQSNIDAVIGSANYDIGHVFSTGGGGVASLGVVCNNGSKARGVTGLPNPIGDPFYVDYVAHEMGHQWGATHTFNGTTSSCGGGNRTGSTAVEPGSGSTIMGYAGICGAENLQSNSDAYFVNASYDQIVNLSRSVGCSVSIPTGNLAPINIDAGMAHTIPANTAFILTATAEDTPGDMLTYGWEQIDVGAAAPPNTDNGNRPIFRSFNPTIATSRTFPKLSDILSQTVTFGESLPTTDRDLNFRVTVRDNVSGGGGVDFSEVTLTVENDAGPFLVTSQGAAALLDGGSMIEVTWDVANTTAAPVNCANVDIELSYDGGVTFTETIADETANDGSEMVAVPNVDETNVRIRVICSDSVFFDINNADLSIQQVFGCVSDWSEWGTPTGVVTDVNGNNVVDIIEVLGCLIP